LKQRWKKAKIGNRSKPASAGLTQSHEAGHLIADIAHGKGEIRESEGTMSIGIHAIDNVAIPGSVDDHVNADMTLVSADVIPESGARVKSTVLI
jgi:hypothetical protein